MSRELQIIELSLGPIGTNCYIVSEQEGTEAFVVDPGAQANEILEAAQSRNLEIKAILVTHCHWDHIGAVAELASLTSAPVWMSDREAPVLEDPSSFPLGGPEPITPATVNHRLRGGEQIHVAGITVEVLSTPGHSPGHLTFLVDGELSSPVAFVGDVIFKGSVGRSDLPFSDGDTLQKTLQELRSRLHVDTMLCSGHGPATTMKHELDTNPFLRT